MRRDMRFRFSPAYLNVLLVGLLAAAAAPASARTLRVERDGSGDYSTIQPAVDAAAPGDTILIGPGQYTELNTYYLPGNGEWVEVGAYVQVDNLTFIGAGPEFTTIGAVTHVYGDESPKGLVYLDPGQIRIEGIRFANYFDGVYVVNARLFVNHCEFDNNVGGIVWFSTVSGGGVFNSHFRADLPWYGISLLGYGQDILVEGCTFDSSYLEIQYVQNFILRDSEVFHGVLGMQISAGATGRVDNCRFHDLSVEGIAVSPVGASCVVVDSEIAGGVNAVYVDRECYFEGWNSVFSGGSNSVFRLNGTQACLLRQSQLFKGSSTYAIACQQFQSQGAIRHDFRGNYWGTDDGDQIATWILDGHDDPQILAEVLYTPFATGDSDLVIALTPNDPEIIIPETGGSFLYDASIENNTGTDIVADLTIEAVLPDGTAYPVMTLPGVTLVGASVRTRIGIVQEVPAAAPAGTYTYRVSASLGDTLLVDTAELPFEKQGGAVAAASPMSWPVTGWLDEDRPPFQGGAVKPVLFGPVPNPFNPTTTVAFELPAQVVVSLHVFDLQGRLVRTLLSGEVVPQGRHEAQWDGRDASGRQAASGTYFFRLEAGGQVETRRAVLVK